MGNARLALGFLLLWLMGIAFFAAFHPGGVMVEGKPAKNPADVLRYLMMYMGGVSSSGSESNGQGSSDSAQTA